MAGSVFNLAEMSPDSVIDVVNNETDRLAAYMEEDKIKDKQSMLDEFTKQFDNNRGQNLLKHFRQDRKLADKLWKTKRVQNAIKKIDPKLAKEDFTVDDVDEAIEKFAEKKEKVQEKREARIEKEKKIDVDEYERDGKIVKGHKRASHEYTDKQSRFIKTRLYYNDNKFLASEFNTFFKVAFSVDAIKAKKLRLRGTKK